MQKMKLHETWDKLVTSRFAMISWQISTRFEKGLAVFLGIVQFDDFLSIIKILSRYFKIRFTCIACVLMCNEFSSFQLLFNQICVSYCQYRCWKIRWRSEHSEKLDGNHCLTAPHLITQWAPKWPISHLLHLWTEFSVAANFISN